MINPDKIKMKAKGLEGHMLSLGFMISDQALSPAAPSQVHLADEEKVRCRKGKQINSDVKSIHPSINLTYTNTTWTQPIQACGEHTNSAQEGPS